MNLYINACVRPESRTARLARCAMEAMGGQWTELILEDAALPALDLKTLSRRMAACAEGNYESPYFDFAKQFASAERILIAAPYWDLSFPAVLKKYLETVSCSGLTFVYTPEGCPVGLCKGRELTYVTTAGGPIVNHDLGFGYVKALTSMLFGIPDFAYFYAENLDTLGYDPEALVSACEKEICAHFSKDL